MLLKRDLRKTLPLAIIFLSFWSLTGIGQTPMPEGRRLRDIVSEKYPDGGLIVGGTTGSWAFGSQTGAILDREFSYVTPENDFKQSVIRSDRTRWNWDRADAWLQHIIDHDQILRMHGPISPQCATWVKEDNRTAQELAVELDTFMTALCKRYNGVERIKYLDVVNEIALDDGSWFGPRPGTDQWENPWLKIGQDTDPNNTPLYIKQAFAIANEYAPDLKLIINNHCHPGTQGMEKVKETALYLMDLGYRIDGIGWQAHVPTGWDTEENLQHLREVIDWCQSRNLEFHVTEFGAENTTSSQTETAQAKTYKNIMDALIEKQDSMVIGWNVWHISDATSWRPERTPSLFDDEYVAKPAYYALQLALEANGDYSARFNAGFRVKNLVTGDVITGSSVTFKNETLEVDENGIAMFNTIAPGQYTVKAQNTLMDPGNWKTVSIYSDTIIDLFLDYRYFSTTFSVINAYDGSPLPSASVTFGDQQQTTGTDGTTVFSVPFGTYSSNVTKTGYTTFMGDFTVMSDTMVTIELSQTLADVKFRLRDGINPVIDAMVILNDDTLYTNQAGVCMLYDQPVGSFWTYQIEKEYFLHVEGNFKLNTDTTLEIQMTSTVAEVRFKLDNESSDIENGMVFFNGDSTGISAGKDAIFFNIPLNTSYSWMVTSDNYETLNGSFTVQSDTTITVSLSTFIESKGSGISLSFYPNPAREILHIVSEVPVDLLTVTDITGRLCIYLNDIQTPYALDIQSLSRGMYFLGIVSEEHQFVFTKPFTIN